ncbi:MAG: aminotransferase class V-fold PLP-dependent enzyme, partial [Proteobacteria bacterium]|nr:aminotransferase class V-fold PLP-dependent enzyme [Pseudomonadota bacterium]
TLGALVASSMLTSGGSLQAATPSVLPGGAAPDDEAHWRFVADQFLIRSDVSYMNTGTRGPSPRSVYQAQIDAMTGYDTDRLSYVTHVNNSDYRTSVRHRLAAYVGAGADEIAFTNNTTEGMVIGTFGLDMKPGDEIVYTNHDHSSGGQPIHLRAARYGIKPVVVDLSDPGFHPPDHPDAILKAFEKAITKKTRLISFCHVNYTDGCVMPVKQICELARERGIATLVDGAHPPGMMQLDLHDLGCDMYAGACHKWMLASMLTGFFYVRADMQERVWPTSYTGSVNGLNMYGVADSAAGIARANTAERYEMHGSRSDTAVPSIDAALAFHTGLGTAAIEARVRTLAGRARSGLAEIPGVRIHVSEDPAMSCGLVAFTLNGVKPKELADRLWTRHRIYIRDVSHPEIGWEVNRASLHIMVRQTQLDSLIGAVREIGTEVGA